MTTSRRVVITGLGAISPFGNSCDDLWSGLSQSQSAIGYLKSFPADYLPSKVAGEATKFTGDISEYGPLEQQMKRAIKKGQKVMCREIEMGVAAAQLAITDARYTAGQLNHERIGVIYGSDYILTVPDEFTEGIKKCMDEQGEFSFRNWAERGMPELAPLWLLKYLPNMPASHIAIYNDFRGPNNSITLREASSNLAVGEAYCTIARGSADMIIAGATGTRVHALRSLHVMLQEKLAAGDGDPAGACRPFDRKRTGMVIGEGAGAIVLEELESARKRGARILGEVLSYGSSTVMTPSGAARYRQAIKNTLTASLRSANLQPKDVGHIHAHGLGGVTCDPQEALAIHDVFADQQPQVPVTAAKSMMGNLGAGSGLVELIASVKALQAGHLFPILNCDQLDADCPIHAVTTADVSAGNSFINVNVTPHGQASAVVVSKFSDN
jgi:3-oxoacyl-[acyl-carrier-protein] synthase II